MSDKPEAGDWDATVAKVADALRPHGLAVRAMPSDTSTALAAASTLHTEVGAIVKSLLFIGGELPILALVSGDRRVEVSRLASVVRCPTVRLARPGEVHDITGHRIGGVPPVAHRTPLTVLMDRTLLSFDRVYAAAGSPLHIFEVTPKALQEISRATVADFVS